MLMMRAGFKDRGARIWWV